MALTILPPPVKPRTLNKVRRGEKIYWTIHTHPNHAFTVRVKNNSQSAMVAFKNSDDAFLVGQMIEKHYLITKEWPETDGQIILPSVSKTESLDFLFCRRWDFEDLKVTCTKNFMNIVVIDDMDCTKSGFEFNGKIISFEAPIDFYVQRLYELFELI